MDDRDAVQQIQNELMLLSRYQFRPHPRSAGMLERSAFLLLSRLELVEAMTLKELSLALTLDTSTVHRQVGALLRSEYVHYVPGLPGEVARRLAPTAAGLAALGETRAINEEGLRSVVGDWPAQRREQFLSLLLRFNQDVEALENTPWPRVGDAPAAGPEVAE
ncbi:MarR family winged helix-turn-helix transcriptional regulator [Arthrobacter sp. N199823]|uniref:MarR family winged helix-turn-helix transcriptional regulator n=1 Tax=Arthrobacter sp. N199823 TaxID=2058895 RepID=UPI000CE41B05|nr:MarR family winged helix-turn-helix transcriptional regulator [Arthrobacter sp. N199823]